MHRFRFLRVLLTYLFRPRKIGPLDEFAVAFRITPFDIDFTRAATHTYYSLTSLAR